jgi:acetate kinase
MSAALDGVDMLVFTGGIGEHDATVRATICDGLTWLGLNLGRTRDGQPAKDANTPTSRGSIRVLPSDEDAQIAIHTSTLAFTVL